MVDHGVRRSLRSLPPMLGDQTFQERVRLPSELLHLLLIAIGTDPIQNGQKIAGIRSSAVGENLFHDLPKKASLFLVGDLIAVVSFSGRHSHHDVKGQLREDRFQIHLSKISNRISGEFSQQSLDLVASDFRKSVEPAGGEDLDGADAAEVPPVVAVGGGNDGGVIVA